MHNSHTNDFEFVGKLMYETFQIPILYMNNKGDMVYEFTSSYRHNPMYESKQTLLNELFNSHEDHPFPILRTTHYLENFICLTIQNEGLFIIGPSIASEPSEQTVKSLIADLNIRHQKQDEFIQYYLSLPVLSNMKAIYAGMHLYYMIYQKKIDASDVIQKNKELVDKVKEIEDPHLSISKGRQDISLHHDEMHEKRMLQSIQEGKKVEAIEYLRSSPETGQIGTLSKNSLLRHKKNLGIVIIAFATRSAMKGGLHHEIAYTLSDLYIQNLEELNNINDVDAFIEDAVSEFADRVYKKKQQNFSKPINLCLNYIFANLYEPITLHDLAEKVNLHPNYLSKLFKQEVGQTIREYIQLAKIEEAKTLLTFTDYSLLKVSTLLNFHDQSYFTKTFKKYTGVTPKQFKNNPEN
ncbi:AraC family transcriptional regulator [Gracilibacillus sp. YIM 98692]|uniref:AraC family transcriptional regulator n=1 Tax=Gracilibacillus sp. YIM 98692 TaxID=2663532 RepID=UPI0013D1057A|nr:AraC family transcriptional regulator [Gracilibacillus sp. YIM 98692]